MKTSSSGNAVPRLACNSIECYMDKIPHFIKIYSDKPVNGLLANEAAAK